MLALETIAMLHPQFSEPCFARTLRALLPLRFVASLARLAGTLGSLNFQMVVVLLILQFCFRILDARWSLKHVRISGGLSLRFILLAKDICVSFPRDYGWLPPSSILRCVFGELAFSVFVIVSIASIILRSVLGR